MKDLGEAFLTVRRHEDDAEIDVIIFYQWSRECDLAPYQESSVEVSYIESEIRKTVFLINLKPYTPTEDELLDWEYDIERAFRNAVESDSDSWRAA
jgi:hypothetical protein